LPDAQGPGTGGRGGGFIRRPAGAGVGGVVRTGRGPARRPPNGRVRPPAAPEEAATPAAAPAKVHHAAAKALASQGMTDSGEGSRETALYRSYRDLRIPLEIVCFDGIVIHGYLKAWERYSLMVQTGEGEMLIMKHGIIRILPKAPRPPAATPQSVTAKGGGRTAAEVWTQEPTGEPDAEASLDAPADGEPG
jgi:sRNA-binding regulator protein Hfq